MKRRAASFTQTAVTRAVKGARAAGADVSKVEIDADGKIVIVIGKPDEKETDGEIVL